VQVLAINGLVINNYTTRLKINDNTEFNITLTNQGNDILNNLFVTLKMQNGFIPENGNEFYADSLIPGQSVIFSTTIFTDKEIEADSFQFYVLEKSNAYSNNATLNIQTIGEPILSINTINLDPSVPVHEQMQTISVQIENIGSSKAYSITSEFKSSDDFKGVKSENLGTLDREDITSTIFEIMIPSNSNELNGTIIITYYDAFGNKNEISQEISYDILDGSSSWIYLVIIALILIASYIVYRKMKKKK
jgi:hypothetical protein